MAGVVTQKTSNLGKVELVRLNDSYVLRLLQLLKDGEHRSFGNNLLIWLKCLFFNITVTDAGNWEQVHIMYAKAEDTTSAGEDAVLDEHTHGNSTCCRAFRSGHVEGGDRTSDSLIFKPTVSLNPWFKH